MKKIISFLSVLVVGIGIGIIGWSYISRPVKIDINKPAALKPSQAIIPTEIVSSPSVGPTAEPTIEYANPSVVIDAIETAVPDKNWPDLLPFMMPNVTLIKYATSCCGVITKNQAISELTYLNDATKPWNFSDKNPIALKLESDDPEHFKEMWIGTSADYHAVGFKWNDKFYIEKISIVGDYRTIIGN
jgi:hypothetical protein